MSSISGLSSGISSYQPSNSSSPFSAIKKDLNAFQSALSSGDLDSAKSAFTSLQTDFQKLPKPPGDSSSTSSSSSSSNNPIQKDLDAIQSALTSGDATAAQTAVKKLATDLQSVKAHHGHGPHGKPPGDGDGSTSSTSSTSRTSSTNTDLTTALLDAIASATGTSSTGGSSTGTSTAGTSINGPWTNDSVNLLA